MKDSLYYGRKERFVSNRTSIIIKPSLEETFQTGWDYSRIILFSAPCGFGKTVVAKALLLEHKVCELSGVDGVFISENIPQSCDTVLIDDLQELLDPEQQKALCELIRLRKDLHFVLLGRGHIPGWLMPFRFAGIMLTIEASTLSFDRRTTQYMLESRGIEVSLDEINAIQRDFGGYPLAVDILCRKLKNGAAYSTDIVNAIRCELFFYYEDTVYNRFEAPQRLLMVSLASFDHFNLEMATILSGDPHAGELLGSIQRDTTMLFFDGVDTYHFWPFFQQFLIWELNQKFTDAEQRILYSRGALYYELQGEMDKALEYYSLAKEQSKVSAMLIKNAEQNVSLGSYREMQNYYFSLTREEILKSASLMCGMSMLTSLCLDYEASEQWYKELQNYGAQLKKGDSEYKIVRAKLAYLDIGLPQRSSKKLIDVVVNAFRLITDKKIKIPQFSVTSTLPSIMNGGKDFCEWSKKDEFLYTTLRKPLEVVLGRDGVGLADCGVCESKFEKGEDVSKRLLTLMSKLGQIQVSGTPDIEFAVIGLLARVQVSLGKAKTALESLESLRAKYIDTAQPRFLPNIDAMVCRIQLQLGETEATQRWLEEKAPKNDVRLWVMWRYQYLTRIMVQIGEGEYEDALLLLARLLPYCDYCERVMDGIHIRLLTALCYERLKNDVWKDEIQVALNTCYEFRFIWPVAQYGIAILPLLSKCGWDKDLVYFEELASAARVQAVQYPRFLKPQLQPVDPLSAAEMQVLKLLCENLSNKEIGEILGVKLSTVKTHVSRILNKLGISRRSEAKAVVEELNLNFITKSYR